MEMLTVLLTVLFVGLKLGHVIGWSWWWVLSPLWIPAVFDLVMICIVIAFRRRGVRRISRARW